MMMMMMIIIIIIIIGCSKHLRSCMNASHSRQLIIRGLSKGSSPYAASS
jgi:hypothetical protein